MNNCTCNNNNSNNNCASHHHHQSQSTQQQQQQQQQQQNNNNSNSSSSSNVRSSYHQKALQQIRNSLQPFATVFTPSSSTSSSPLPPATSSSNSQQQPPPPPYPFLFPRCPSPQQQSQPPSPPPQQQQQHNAAAAAAYAYYQNNGYFTPPQQQQQQQQQLNQEDYFYAQSQQQQPPGTITPTTSSNSNRQSPNTLVVGANLPPPPATRPGAIEYRAQQYPFVPSQVPMNVQQLLRRIDLTNTSSCSRTNSPPLPRYTSSSNNSSRTPPPPPQPLVYKPTSKKPTLIIKSTVVPKPVLQTATNVVNSNSSTSVNGAVNSSCNGASQLGSPPPPPPPYKDAKMGPSCVANGTAPPPPLPPKPGKKAPPLLLPPPPPEPVHHHQPLLQHQQQQQVHQQDRNGGGGGGNVQQEIIHTHESPIPERKKLSKEKEEERFESKVRVYSPAAFKFFMEQHVENVIKSHQERLHRRLQLESEMAKIGLSEEAQTQMRKMLSQKESNYIRLKRAKMDKSMFKVIRTIGVGAFGEVALVRKIDTQLLYAMKTLRKSDVLRRNQVAHVKAERDILAEADNEWVVKLYYSFQDKDHLYFVMDYIPGGDLMSLLIKKGIFEEPLAQFYIAELTCAIESVHKMGFIHRDIKPDNILIDRDGHIKLTDFGLCTGFRWTHNSKYYQDNTAACSCCTENTCNEHTRGGPKVLERRRMMMRGKDNNIRCLAHSLVGTPNYIAPEVLLRTGYTQLCDWWSVGVILYEMLVGQPPFLAPTPAETQFKVINWEKTLRIPSNACVSREARDLILKLCTDHSRRLGKNGAHQIKNHPFLHPIFHPATSSSTQQSQSQQQQQTSDYSDTLSTTSSTNSTYSSSSPSSISSTNSCSSSCSSSSSPAQPINIRRTLAPYIPKIAHPTDTSNFDPCEEESVDSRLNFEDEFNDNNNQFHGFFEFTFRRFFDDAYHLEDLAAAAAAAASREGGGGDSSSHHRHHHNNNNSHHHHHHQGKSKDASRNGPVYV